MNHRASLKRFTTQIKHTRSIQNGIVLHSEPVNGIESGSQQIPDNMRFIEETRISNGVHRNVQDAVRGAGGSTKNIAVGVKQNVQARILDGENEEAEFVVVGASGEENDGVWTVRVIEEVEAVAEEEGSGVVLIGEREEGGDGGSGGGENGVRVGSEEEAGGKEMGREMETGYERGGREENGEGIRVRVEEEGAERERMGTGQKKWGYCGCSCWEE